MNRTRLPCFACATLLALLLSACGNRGPLVLPEEAPPPMADPAAEPAAQPTDAAPVAARE